MYAPSKLDYLFVLFDKIEVDSPTQSYSVIASKTLISGVTLATKRVWRYQRGNQNPYIEEQTTQWPKENGQWDKQQSTKHTLKIE